MYEQVSVTCSSEILWLYSLFVPDTGDVAKVYALVFLTASSYSLWCTGWNTANAFFRIHACYVLCVDNSLILFLGEFKALTSKDQSMITW